MIKKINMNKKEKFVKILDLSVSQVLFSFINKELLPGTKISKNHFWKGFNIPGAIGSGIFESNLSYPYNLAISSIKSISLVKSDDL